jgi:hypothetical protein
MDIITYFKVIQTGLGMSQFAKNIMPKHEKTQIIDPLSTIIRLVINGFKPIGTKICVYENRISLQEPSYIQGSLRTVNGDSKEDLHFLLEPIKNACGRLIQVSEPNKKQKLKYLFKKAKIGLINLKNTYETYPLISRCVELYINYLDIYFEEKNIDELEKNENITNSIVIEKEIYNKIYDNFDRLWTENRLNIVYSLLQEIDKLNNKGKTKEINDMIQILDDFVIIIEKEGRNSLTNII